MTIINKFLVLYKQECNQRQPYFKKSTQVLPYLENMEYFKKGKHVSFISDSSPISKKRPETWNFESGEISINSKFVEMFTKKSSPHSSGKTQAYVPTVTRARSRTGPNPSLINSPHSQTLSREYCIGPAHYIPTQHSKDDMDITNKTSKRVYLTDGPARPAPPPPGSRESKRKPVRRAPPPPPTQKLSHQALLSPPVDEDLYDALSLPLHLQIKKTELSGSFNSLGNRTSPPPVPISPRPFLSSSITLPRNTKLASSTPPNSISLTDGEDSIYEETSQYDPSLSVPPPLPPRVKSLIPPSPPHSSPPPPKPPAPLPTNLSSPDLPSFPTHPPNIIQESSPQEKYVLQEDEEMLPHLSHKQLSEHISQSGIEQLSGHISQSGIELSDKNIVTEMKFDEEEDELYTEMASITTNRDEKFQQEMEDTYTEMRPIELTSGTYVKMMHDKLQKSNFLMLPPLPLKSTSPQSTPMPKIPPKIAQKPAAKLNRVPRNKLSAPHLPPLPPPILREFESTGIQETETDDGDLYEPIAQNHVPRFDQVQLSDPHPPPPPPPLPPLMLSGIEDDVYEPVSCNDTSIYI